MMLHWKTQIFAYFSFPSVSNTNAFIHPSVRKSVRPSVRPSNRSSIHLPIYGYTSLFQTLAPLFSFLILYRTGRTPWTGISPSQGLYILTKQNRINAYRSMSLMGFEPHDLSIRASKDSSRLRPLSHCDRHQRSCTLKCGVQSVKEI
jgi:hypothetical protein